MKNENYYVLYCQSSKIEQLLNTFNQKEGIIAFIPKIEKHIHSKKEMVVKALFPGYLFIKTSLIQVEFDTLLTLMYDQKNGLIRELKKDDVSALTKEEIQLFHLLLNEDHVLVTSRGYKKDGRTIITEGPLKIFQKYIIAVDKREHLAILNIEFMSKKIKAGIEIEDQDI